MIEIGHNLHMCSRKSLFIKKKEKKILIVLIIIIFNNLSMCRIVFMVSSVI